MTATRRGDAPVLDRGGPGVWWPRIKRLVTIAFFVVVAWFIVRYALGVKWAQVWASIVATPWQALAGAAALCAASHALYSCFDLLGRHYTGHTLSARRAWTINLISYAFNLNLGSLVGAVAFRFRMYSRSGLDNATITRIMTLSMLSNWLGYLLLGGALFALWPLQLPPDWKLAGAGLRWMGIGMLATALLYIAMCMWSSKRRFMVRGHEVLLPPRRMVPVQIVIAVTNWALMGAIVWLLLGLQVPYAAVLSVLLVGAIAGVITHVPAGLGVLEAVFIALLSHRIPEYELLAGLLVYRALYYIAPLIIGTILYLLFEARVTHAANKRAR